MRARVSSTSPSGTASRIVRPMSAGTATRYCGGSSARSRRIARPTSPRRACETSYASPIGRPTVAFSAESPWTSPSAPMIVMRALVTRASRGANRSGCPASRSQSATSTPCLVMRESSDAIRSFASVRSIANSVPAPTMITSARNVSRSRLRSELRTPGQGSTAPPRPRTYASRRAR